MFNLIDAQRKIAPEAVLLIDRRYTVLKEIYFSKTVGRRLLANKLDLSERIVRNEIDFLKAENLVAINPLGITITDLGIEILEALDEYVGQIRGLSSMELLLEEAMDIKKVLIAPASCSGSNYALKELGKLAAKYFMDNIEENSIVGLTGGYTLRAFADQVPKKSMPNLNVVPARGGVGEILEIQSNTIVSKLAKKLDAPYKILQVPDDIDEDIMARISMDAGIKAVYEYIKKIDTLVFGIGNAEDLSKRRNISTDLWMMLREKGAVAESFGYYFDIDGNTVYETGTVGIKLDEYKKMKNIIAVAGGSNKAEAILSISKINKNLVLVMDEDAAYKIMYILKININSNSDGGTK